MPLYTAKPGTPPVEQSPILRLTEPQYKGIVTDSRFVPKANILKYVIGSRWEVLYYSQVLNTSNELSGQQQTLDPIHQQYNLIKRLELKVTQDLQQDQDPNDSTFSVKGVANVYPGTIIPNVGDMFLADIGDGNEGVFRVTNVQRKTFKQESTYEIEYIVTDYSTPDRRGDLNVKVVDTFEFEKDFLIYGQNPLIREDDFTNVKLLVNHYDEMVSRYFRLFTSIEYRTLLVPAQQYPIYDHFLTKFIMGMFTADKVPEIRTIRILNCDDDKALATSQLWTLLKDQSLPLLKHCVKKAGLVSTRLFQQNPQYMGIRYSGIAYVVYPDNPELTVDYTLYRTLKDLDSVKLVSPPSELIDLSELIAQPNLDDEAAIIEPPIIKPLLVDDYYVLSEAFYKGDRLNQSQLELCVTDYLEDKPQQIKQLLKFCTTYSAWGPLERFYYMPIVLMLIKATVRSL